MGHVRRPAADGALDEHSPLCQPRHDAVPGEETGASRGHAGRALGNDQAAVRDGVEQLGVRGWVCAIGAAWEHGDGGSAGDEGTAVGSLVDAVRRAADDGLAHGCEISAEVACLFQAVARRGA